MAGFYCLIFKICTSLKMFFILQDRLGWFFLDHIKKSRKVAFNGRILIIIHSIYVNKARTHIFIFYRSFSQYWRSKKFVSIFRISWNSPLVLNSINNFYYLNENDENEQKKMHNSYEISLLCFLSLSTAFYHFTGDLTH